MVGDSNAWNGRAAQMTAQGTFGEWESFVSGAPGSAVHKYEIERHSRRSSAEPGVIQLVQIIEKFRPSFEFFGKSAFQLRPDFC